MQLVAAMVEVYDYDYDQYESSSPVVDPSEAPPYSFPTTVTSNEQRLARTTPELILNFSSAFYANMESSLVATVGSSLLD